MHHTKFTCVRHSFPHGRQVWRDLEGADSAAEEPALRIRFFSSRSDRECVFLTSISTSSLPNPAAPIGGLRVAPYCEFRAVWLSLQKGSNPWRRSEVPQPLGRSRRRRCRTDASRSASKTANDQARAGQADGVALLTSKCASIGRPAAINVKSLKRHSDNRGTYRRKRLRVACMYIRPLAHYWRAAESTYGAYFAAREVTGAATANARYLG